MRALKALVIVMGILILAGLAAVAFTVARRAGAPADEPVATGTPPGISAPAAGAGTPAFGTVQVPLADGYAYDGATAEGGRLLVRLRGRDGRGRIVVLDLATGRRLGIVEVAPDAALPAAR
jgi:hypothetical protein